MQYLAEKQQGFFNYFFLILNLKVQQSDNGHITTCCKQRMAILQ